jgi:predicted glycoside hydrolase/deacetylase ChbG (UPF0249 family)
MNFIKYHIDDFGLTKSISNKLLYLIAKKPKNISGISVVLNTNKDVGNLIKKIIKLNNKISINLHLNLIDGKAMSKKHKKIINKKGYFKFNFLNYLLLKFNIDFLTYKNELRDEIESQLKLYLKILKDIKYKNPTHISLDSHQYVHQIPWIFNLILSLSSKYKIVFIRSTNEPFILSHFSNFFKLWFYKNLFKFFILRFFNFINSKKRNLYNIRSNKYFYGIINSGNMNRKYINSIKVKSKSNIQILFHPNIAIKKEKFIFDDNKKLLYYLSKKRIDEYNFILNV